MITAFESSPCSGFMAKGIVVSPPRFISHSTVGYNATLLDRSLFASLAWSLGRITHCTSVVWIQFSELHRYRERKDLGGYDDGFRIRSTKYFSACLMLRLDVCISML